MDLIANASGLAVTSVGADRSRGVLISACAMGRWSGAGTISGPRGAFEEDKSVLTLANKNMTRIRLPRRVPH